MLITDSKGTIIYGIISAVLHELGHLLCMRFFGYSVKTINFGCLNTDIISCQFEDKKSILIFLSGSFINFSLAVIFGVLFFIYKTSLFKIIAYQNIGLGAFNLLPISNLDGGQIFYTFLKKKLDEFSALKVLNVVSFTFIVPVFILGFYVLINSKYNFSLFILSLYLISYILFKEDIF